MNLLNNNKGFTLIELLVVIAIIGVLAGLVAISTSSSRGEARDARRLSDLRQIQSAQEFVMADDESYKKSAGVAGEIPAIENSSGRRYMMPVKDPLNNSSYKYVWIANNAGACSGLSLGKYYCAVAKLEARKNCPAGQTRYFAVNNRGSREICAPADYVASPPSCSVCLAF